MLLWLFALHAWELTVSFVEASLPALLAEGQCEGVYAVAVEAFRRSPVFPDAVAKHFNGGKMACLERVLDAYYDTVMLPEWSSIPTPNRYDGPLSQSAPIPDYTPPHAKQPNPNDNPTRFKIDIAGQSKQPDSTPTLTSIHTPTGQVVYNFGEDAVGVSKDTVVVCDGVGGASHSEIVSFAVTHLTLRLATQPKWDLLAASTKLITSIQTFLQRSSFTGSTTFLAAQIDHHSKRLHIVNVGDCQAAVMDGENRIVLLSEEQWWAPNTPYQLNGNPAAFKARMAARYTVGFERGFRLVLASDGVGDNVWPRQVAAAGTAHDILKVAREQAGGAVGTNIPFSKKMGWALAGKMDDMSVVVVYL